MKMEIFEDDWIESKSQSDKIYLEKIEAVRRKLNELEEKGVQVSISSTFYVQLLRLQIPKA